MRRALELDQSLARTLGRLALMSQGSWSTLGAEIFAVIGPAVPPRNPHTQNQRCERPCPKPTPPRTPRPAQPSFRPAATHRHATAPPHTPQLAWPYRAPLVFQFAGVGVSQRAWGNRCSDLFCVAQFCVLACPPQARIPTPMDVSDAGAPPTCRPLDDATAAAAVINSWPDNLVDDDEKWAYTTDLRLRTYLKSCDRFPIDSVDQFCSHAAFLKPAAKVKTFTTEAELTDISEELEFQKGLQHQLATALRTALKDCLVLASHPPYLPWSLCRGCRFGALAAVAPDKPTG